MPGGKGLKNTIVAIDVVDRRIEQGLVYYAIARDPLVGTDESLDMLIVTPPGPPIAMSANSLYGSLATIEAFEGADIADNGAEIITQNYRRIPPIRPAETQFFTAPTINDDGAILISEILLPGGAQGQNTAGGVYETLFFILAPSTNYIVRLTNLSNTDSVMTIIANFAELVGPASSGT